MEIIKDHLALGHDAIDRRFGSVDPFKHMAKQIGKFPVAGILLEELDDGFGNKILKPIESNTVVVGGAILALEKLCGVSSSFLPTTLNSILNINASETGTFANSSIKLFGCGTGGAGLDFGSVIAPDIKQNNVKDLVPMRYGATVSGDDAAKYFMKGQAADGVNNAWYLKEFDAAPTIHTRWKNSVDGESDGTEITGDISDSSNTEGIESYAEFQLSLNTNDVREYFEATGQINLARYNTIGFYTGEKKSLTGGGTDYVNVRLASVITFNNRDVSTKTAASYRYRIYSLI